VRLFIDWLELYHESHFAVIREIFKSPGSTRFDIWFDPYGDTPREDSAEADLFKLLIRDLSTGGVIRQERDVDESGQFVRRRPRRSRPGSAPSTMREIWYFGGVSFPKLRWGSQSCVGVVAKLEVYGSGRGGIRPQASHY
jgi:hypothetical protein